MPDSVSTGSSKTPSSDIALSLTPNAFGIDGLVMALGQCVSQEGGQLRSGGGAGVALKLVGGHKACLHGKLQGIVVPGGAALVDDAVAAVFQIHQPDSHHNALGNADAAGGGVGGGRRAGHQTHFIAALHIRPAPVGGCHIGKGRVFPDRGKGRGAGGGEKPAGEEGEKEGAKELFHKRNILSLMISSH